MSYQDVLVHNFQYDDGGRAEAGFEGTAGDCAVRAIAIATELPYAEVHKQLSQAYGASADLGVSRECIHEFLVGYGWKWVPTMGIGTGCKVHLKAEELPAGRIVARVSKHVSAVIGGVVCDTHDPSRGGSRCVYGYWTKKEG